MDLRAVKAATGPELAAYACAVAPNAQGLLHDAEVLAGAGSIARAYSLAVLSVEACGKAAGLVVLAVLPRRERARAPVRRMLEWHQLKQIGGLIVARIPVATLAAMPSQQSAQIINNLGSFADEADSRKRRGFYVDMDSAGRICDPSQITQAELSKQLAMARRAVASASTLMTDNVQSRLAHPTADSRELAEAMVAALGETGSDRSPEAAASVVTRTVDKLRDHPHQPLWPR